jgi:hypothetical protein
MTWRELSEWERFAPAFALFHFGAVLMAVDFGQQVWRGGSPITPELYGPSVYEFPALAWVSVQLGGSFLALAGSIITARLGAVMAVIGGLISGTMYSALAVMASEAASGTLLVAGASYTFAPVSFIGALLALRFLLRGRDDGEGKY